MAGTNAVGQGEDLVGGGGVDVHGEVSRAAGRVEAPELPTVVGVTGFKQSGKDTFARVLIKEAGYVRIAFADALKRDAAAWLGITVEEIERRKSDFRATLQCYGAKMRGRYDGYWIQKLEAETLAALPADARVVVTDVRHPNEADWVRARGGLVVRQVRAGQYTTNDTHSSEREVEAIAYDRCVDVDSIEDREAAARVMLKQWGWDS